jgi:hypothetical protein
MYRCEICGYNFSRVQHLTRHVRSSHERDKPHACPQCGRSFARTYVIDCSTLTWLYHKLTVRSDALARHRRSHQSSGEKADPRSFGDRISQACTNCNRAKVRCDEAKPCNYCLSRNWSCDRPPRPTQTQQKMSQSHSLLNRADSLGDAKCHASNLNIMDTMNLPTQTPSLVYSQSRLIAENNNTAFQTQVTPGGNQHESSSAPSELVESVETQSFGSEITHSGLSITPEYNSSSDRPHNSHLRSTLSESSSGFETVQRRPTSLQDSFNITSSLNILNSGFGYDFDIMESLPLDYPFVPPFLDRQELSSMPEKSYAIAFNGVCSPNGAPPIENWNTAKIRIPDNLQPDQSILPQDRPKDFFHHTVEYSSAVHDSKEPRIQPVPGNKASFPELDEMELEVMRNETLDLVDRLPQSTYDQIVQHAKIACNLRATYTRLNISAFPPETALNCFVQLYFRHFQLRFPVVHQPTFSPVHSHWIEVMAIATIGCRFSKVRVATKIAHAMSELLRILIFQLVCSQCLE